MEYVMNGRNRPRMGNNDEIMAPHGCYPCKGEDKWVAIAVSNDEEWDALRKAMGNPVWGNDTKFSDKFNRWLNRDELNKLIADWTKEFTHYEVMHKLQDVGVRCRRRSQYPGVNKRPSCGRSVVFLWNKITRLEARQLSTVPLDISFNC